MVPVTTHAGEWLESRVGHDPLVEKHTELGDGLLPWAGALFLVTAAVWWMGRRPAGDAESAAEGGAERTTADARWRAPKVLHLTAVVLAVVIGVVDVYRIGESGAKAAWHDNYDKSASGQRG
jgi:hypothetical protein